jgi:DNA modification methylase
MSKTDHKIIIGDSRRMSEIQDESVHLVITSPPYWQLKDYGTSEQIGFDDSYEDYINNLNLVWSECCRVLHQGCRLCINIGDQFARSVYYGRYKIIPIRTEIIRFCETIGMDYMGAIIWQKVTTCNTTGGATVMGSFPYPRNGILKIDYEFILIFKKLGNPPRVGKAIKEKSRMTKDEWNQYFSGHWNFAGEKQDKHIAMFPEELPHRLIKMFSFQGDIVLDPFLGSGTTTLAAINLERNSMGYEINREFLPIIKEKIGLKQEMLFDDTSVDFIFQKDKIDNRSRLFKKLPYIFKDPIRFDKKVDPKKLSFGSNIDGEKHSREKYYKIKQVKSPEEIILDNGLKIRLLGIKTDPQKRDQAVEFLKKATNGQLVFLKYDEMKYDNHENLLAYLFLKNKTLINAHLIKKGLAQVETRHTFKYKSKFLSAEKVG